MKVAAYLRISTDRQAEEGLGLDVQEQAIRVWAKDHGHRIVAWYRDEGQSGSNGLDRPLGLGDAFRALTDGLARGLVVYRLDRLARDLIVQEQLLMELRGQGADVFSTSPPEQGYLTDDADDPSRKLIRQVLEAVAEYEGSMIALATAVRAAGAVSPAALERLYLAAIVARRALADCTLDVEVLTRGAERLAERLDGISLPTAPIPPAYLDRDRTAGGKGSSSPPPDTIVEPAMGARPQEGASAATPVMVIAGPVDRIADVEDVALHLENCDALDISFRLFRAGCYRVDGTSTDLETVAEELAARKDVLSVSRHGSTIHVVPASQVL
jgi:Resolvase, N terminal domain